MTWVRIDEEFSHHPKVIQAGPLGIALQVAALCYANKYLTDGFIPVRVVPTLLDLNGLGMRLWRGELIGGGEDADWVLVVEDLLAAGLWEEVQGGYMIHDYHDYQPTKQEVLELREKRREAGQKGGLAKAKAIAKQPASNGSSKTEANLYPVPDPVPGPVPDTETVTKTEPSRARARSIEAAKWKPNAELIEWCASEFPEVDIVAETQKFQDHFAANGKPMKDWSAAWRNWMRRSREFRAAER